VLRQNGGIFEKWIELLSLAATGRQDIVAPYPPYFKSESGEELENNNNNNNNNVFFI